MAKRKSGRQQEEKKLISRFQRSDREKCVCVLYNTKMFRIFIHKKNKIFDSKRFSVASSVSFLSFSYQKLGNNFTWKHSFAMNAESKEGRMDETFYFVRFLSNFFGKKIFLPRLPFVHSSSSNFLNNSFA